MSFLKLSLAGKLIILYLLMSIVILLLFAIAPKFVADKRRYIMLFFGGIGAGFLIVIILEFIFNIFSGVSFFR